MYYAAKSLDMGVTNQIGVLLQAALLYFSAVNSQGLMHQQ